MTVWEIFYAPHTNDESISMAGAITRARRADHAVMCVLVTDDLPTEQGVRQYVLPDVVRGRKREWIEALSVLDVNEFEMWGIGEDAMMLTPWQVQGDIERRMRALHERLAPVYHHTVWGIQDIDLRSRSGNLSHGLCANALTRLAYRVPSVFASLYAVYLYNDLAHVRRAPVTQNLTEEEFQQKRLALDCYRPHDDCEGYGYASAPDLMDNAAADPHEYCVEISHVS